MIMEIAIKRSMDQEEDAQQLEENQMSILAEIPLILTKKLFTRKEDYLQKNKIKRVSSEMREEKAQPNGNKVKMTNKTKTKD